MNAVPALRVYADALRRRSAILRVVDDTGRTRTVDPGRYRADRLAGDAAMLARCAGPTLDVGCGPGRLTAALLRRGRPALGIDICVEAVRQARRRGATALRRDVFAPLPGAGRWPWLLLADGNIGIGGDPDRLLRRCAELLAPAGRIIVEVDPPGSGTWAGLAALSTMDAVRSAPFRWAYVDAGDIAAIAAASALRTLETWTEAGRWFAALAPR